MPWVRVVRGLWGLRNRRRWGGEWGSIWWPWRWMTTWWWNQHNVVRLCGVVGAALGFGGDVVGLEPVAALASDDGASAPIAVEDVSAEFGGDGPGGRTDREGVARRVLVVEDLDLAITEDLFEGEGPDAGSGGDLGSGFPVGWGSQVGVYEDRHQRNRRTFGFGAVERVLGDGDQSVGVALGAGGVPTVGHGGELVGSGGEGLVDDLPVGSGDLSPQFVGGLVQGGLHRQEPFPRTDACSCWRLILWWRATIRRSPVRSQPAG